MKILDVKQGSPEWLQARLGIPTASNFDRIVTKTGKLSSACDRYLAQLCAEWFIGEPLDAPATDMMARGNGMEAEAVRFYEFQAGVDTTPVGLCLRDDGKVGGSPDRLVGTDGGLEIKCPSATVHMMYLLGEPPDDYRCQVQGILWLTGRKWWDLLCFNPALPECLVRHERDPAFIAQLAAAVEAFVMRLDEAKERLKDQKVAHMLRGIGNSVRAHSDPNDIPAELTP